MKRYGQATRYLAFLLALVFVWTIVAGCAQKPTAPIANGPADPAVSLGGNTTTANDTNRYYDSLEELKQTAGIDMPTLPSASTGTHNYKDWLAAQEPAQSTQIKDAEGNLLVPFDCAYPESFSSGDHEYAETHALLKLDGDVATLSKELRACGFVGLEKSTETEKGTWYRAAVSGTTDVVSAVTKARELDEVLMADYDYIYRAEAVNYLTENEKNNELVADVLGNGQVKNQWYLKSSAIQESWKFLQKNGSQAGGSSSVVIAVIDTGVDYNHPDLKANMWINTAEIPGNGIDDDENGYVDDVYGIDAIAGTGDPMDDHGHGTHVAGIAAASNNKEGVVGVAYNAKIMAVKAGQSTGVFNQSDIAEAILYAYEMGADVINMSFGGTACSIPVQDALSTAYTRSTLVASAGNSGYPNEITDYYTYPLPNYPAALSYVIGVMSVNENGTESAFSNWDAVAYNAVEYEVYAPGEQIMSTLPGGRYGSLSGTSMAAPVVAGAAALLRSYYTDRDMYPSKFIAAQLCATSQDTATCCNPQRHTVSGMAHNLPMILNVYDALTKLPKPDVSLYDYYLFDDEALAAGNNGDGVIDAGETVNIGAILRNRWGMSKDTVVTIDAVGDLGMANPYVEILTATSDFESVGTYSTKDQLIRLEDKIVVGTEEPLVIKIADNCPNDYLIRLNVTVTCTNALDSDDRSTYVSKGVIEFWVRNGVILKGQITEDQTWTKDNYYIVTNSLYIPKDVTVTVEPGTHIQFWTDDPQDPYADTYMAYINVAGRFIVKGSTEEPVEMFPSEPMGNYCVEITFPDNGYVELNHATITNPFVEASKVDRCIFNQNYTKLIYYRYLSGGVVYDSNRAGHLACQSTITNSVFYKLGSGGSGGFVAYAHFDNCVFVNSQMNFLNEEYYQNAFTFCNNCVFVGNNVEDSEGYIWNSSFLLKDELSSLSYSIWRDGQTGTTYVYLNGSKTGGLTRATYAYYDAVAKSLGGHIAILETPEEVRQVSRIFAFTRQPFCVDLPNGSGEWANGVPVDPSIKIIPGAIDYPYYQSDGTLSYRACDQLIGSDGNLIINYSDDGVLLEIPGSVYLESLSLQETDVTVDDQTSYRITVDSVYPTSFDPKDLLYVSSDPTVATVAADGTVTPVRPGQVDIHVYSPDYIAMAKCRMTITEKIPLVSLSLPDVTLDVGETLTPSPVFTPANTTEKWVTYASDNASVVTVENGRLIAKAMGTATVTATAGSVSTAFDVTVTRAAKQIAFTDPFYVTYMGDTDTSWKPILTPADAVNAEVAYTSSNPEVAYVDEGGALVRVAAGTAILRASVVGTDLYADLTISVSAEPINTSAEVVQMANEGGYILAVLSDNTLWRWGGGEYRMPEKVADDVISASLSYGNVYAVNTAGELRYLGYIARATFGPGNSQYTTAPLLNGIRKVVAHSSCIYAIAADGTVWAQGVNSYGELGIGTMQNCEDFTQVELLDVKDICAVDGRTYFLCNSGELYVAGVTDRGTMATPTLVMNGVNEIAMSSRYDYTNRFIAYTDSGAYSISKGFNIKNVTDYLNSCYILDHQAHIYIDSYGLIDTSGLQVERIFGFEDPTVIYLQTTDGKLYAVGDNSQYQLANLSNINRYVPTRIFFNLGVDEKQPEVEDTNLQLTPEEPIQLTSISECNNIEMNLPYKGISAEEYTVVGTVTSFYWSNQTGGSNIISIRIESEHYGMAVVGLFSKDGTIPYESMMYTLKEGDVVCVTGKLMQDVGMINGRIRQVNGRDISFADGMLREGSITLDFNAALLTSSAYGQIKLVDENGTLIGIRKTVELDRLTIAPVSALVNGQTYCLYIPESAFTSAFGVATPFHAYRFTYESMTPIALASATIADGDVFTDSDWNAHFTYSFATQGENFAGISLQRNGTPVDVAVNLQNSVLTLAGTLDAGVYTLTIPAGALADNIGGVSEALTLSFTVTQAPRLLTSSVEDGAVRVDEREALVLTFTGGQTSANFAAISLTDAAGRAVALTAAFENGTLTLSHDTLAQGMTYTLTIPANALSDNIGNGNEAVTLTFETYAPADVAAASVSAETKTFAKDSKIRLYYNGIFTLDASKFSLTSAAGAVELRVTSVGAVVTIAPVSPLETNTAYTLTVAEGAMVDERGALSPLYTVTFETIPVGERFFWQETDIHAAEDAVTAAGVGFFTGNAILNNLNDTNVEHWLRLTAESGYHEYSPISVTGNYWGTTNPDLIDKQIVDFDDFQSLADIYLGEILTEAPSHTFPFVTDAYLLNKDGERVFTVSNETVTFVVEFNRDMDTTVPLRVRFGSSKPYGEYEIEGTYVTARRWEGTYTLKTTIENGNQYLNIQNGCAAGDAFLALYDVPCRFMFEIDTTAAQAMLMQGVATETGIQLSWMQDDFDTLAGYNVYRSDEEDGFYQRLNDTVLPVDTKEFFDSTVEPGRIYYYNFTVVQTDLSESIPSGKIIIMSMDTMAPDIYHTPVRTGYTGSNLIVNATITDNMQIKSATLYYRTVGETTWRSVTMTAHNSRYSAIISSDHLTTDGIEYYIDAFDGISHTCKGTADAPYTVTVKLAVDQNALGDVDGNGAIEIKDALMVLQAANDRLNLSEEQFLRADLNGDGILSAAEALKILKYANGSITSIQ